MAGTYWLTVLPDTSKLKSAINASMQGVKIKADFGIDEAKARKAGQDAAKAAEDGASKSKPKVKPEADKPASKKAGKDAADEAGREADKNRPKVKPQADHPSSRKAGEDAGQSVVGGMKSSLGAIGPMLAGLGLGAALKASLAEGMDFTTSLNTMGAVSGATTAQLAEVSAAARQLGSDASLPGVSALTAAQAMTELAKGGLNVSQAMEAARGTLQLAGAASVDAATAATIQADALNAFQLGAGEAGRVADMLANVANASSGEVVDFAQGLAQAGAVAHGFNIPIEDTITSLGLFANMGIKGSDAGTLMKSSLLAITDGGKPATEAMNALGLQLYKNGQFVGYPEMLNQVAAASQRMTEEQFQGASAVLFGSDAMRGAMIAANGGAEAFDGLRESVTRQGGAAAVAEAKTRGLPGAWASFQNTMDNVKLSIYDLVEGPLTTLLNKLTGLPDFVSRNADAFKIAAGVITTLLVPALTLWIATQAKALAVSVIGSITTMVAAWGTIAGAIASATAAAATYAIVIARTVAASVLAGLSTMVAAFRSLAIGTRIAAAAQAVFNLVLMANPIGLIVAAIAAVVAGLIYFFTQTELGQKIWRGFTEYLTKAWDSIKSAFATAWEFIGGIWDSMVTKAGEVWDGIKTRFTAIVDFVKALPAKISNAANGMWDGIGNAFKSMVDKLKGWWNGFASKLSFTSPDWLPGDPVSFSLPTFRKGGYTGSTGIDSVAGVVHGGEHVINASSRKRLENAYPGLLDFMNRTGTLPLPGYKGGGTVALGNISGPGITTDEQRSMWDAVRQAFPSAVLTSATREVMTEGHPDYHNAGRAIDISGPGMGQVAAWIAKNFPDSLELIHSPFDSNINNGKDVGDGFGFYGAGTMAGHKDHVHWALGKTANSDLGSATSASSSSSSSSGGGSYRSATSSELSASASRVSSAGKAVTQAQQRVDDRTFNRDQAQKRLDAASAAGEDTTAEEESLRRANRELTDANDNLAEKRNKAAEVESADTELRTRGKLDTSAPTSEGELKKSGPGGMDGSSLGQTFVSGLLESIGLDGSLFSNPLEWPSIKSLTAGVNFAGGLLANATGAGGDTAGGFASGAADSVGLGGLLSAIPQPGSVLDMQSGSPQLAPGEFNPGVPGGVATASGGSMSAFAPHGGAGGAAPGPAVDNSININGNVGMSPADVQTKLRTEQNSRTRTTKVNG
jgi:TP901 family phage tail tape measure protein